MNDLVSICTLSARKWDFYDLVYRLSKQTYKNIEWVFVDYLCEENKPSVEYLSSLLSIPITHIKNDLDSKYAWNIAGNRNKALVHSKGAFIIFLDDFTVIDNGFVQNHLKCINNTNDVSCGRMFYMKDECFSEFCSVETVLKNPYEEDSRWNMSEKPTKCLKVLGDEWTYTGNLCVSMEMFLKTNGFDPRLSSRGEDSDFGLRAGKLGANIIYNPTAMSVNLCTKNNPILSNTCKEGFCDVENFRTTICNESDFYKYSKQLQKVKITKRYDCDVVVCTTCNAEYILNPHKFVYDKLNNGEYTVPKELFNLINERKRI